VLPAPRAIRDTKLKRAGRGAGAGARPATAADTCSPARTNKTRAHRPCEQTENQRARDGWNRCWNNANCPNSNNFCVPSLRGPIVGGDVYGKGRGALAESHFRLSGGKGRRGTFSHRGQIREPPARARCRKPFAVESSGFSAHTHGRVISVKLRAARRRSAGNGQQISHSESGAGTRRKARPVLARRRCRRRQQGRGARRR